MPAVFSFTSPAFSVTSAVAIDARTVRVNLTAPPDAFVPANFSIPTTTVVAAVVDPFNSSSVILSVSPPLAVGNYTVTCSGLTSSSVAMSPPLNAAFSVLLPAPVVLPPGAPVGATNPTAESTLRAFIPPSMKGNVWAQLLATLGEEEQFAWDQAGNVYDQLFLVSANGQYLDERASGAGGYQRPELVGFTDDVFRDLVIQLSTRKLTLNAFLRILEIYYGIDAVRAHAQSTAPETFSLAGTHFDLMVDGLGPFVVPVAASDFDDSTHITAIEAAIVLNRGFASISAPCFALPFVNSQTNQVFLNVYSKSRGLRGSIQVLPSSTAFAFPTDKKNVQTMTRAAYVRALNGTVEVILPATSIVVVRTPNQDAAYINDLSVEVGGGPYLHDPPNSLAIDDTATTLSQNLEAGHQYPSIQVASTAGFPDTRGFVVAGFGFSYQTGAIPYLGVSGPNTLLLDPAFTIPVAVPSGAVVNLAHRFSDSQMPHGDEDFWLTPSPAGRVSCENDINSVAAGGREVIMTVEYPGDIGLGGAGLPTHGVPRLSDIVGVFAGDDADAEVAAARES